jgi:hypothetical protein
MGNLQEAANKPPLVMCAIGKRIATPYRRPTFLRTQRLLLHGEMTFS